MVPKYNTCFPLGWPHNYGTISMNPFRLLLLCTILLPASSFAQGQEKVVSIAPSLAPFVEKHELAGAVMLVADKAGVRHVECVGYADIHASRPMTEDTLFWIASQSKPMTAVAVLMLVDDGKIKLDDPVEKYLPEFKDQMVVVESDPEHRLLKKPSHPITIRETLSHMSGMPFKSAVEEPTLDSLPLQVAVRTYAITPLTTQPGTAYQYSNAGINTAARIIEVVTGGSYEKFMQERLFNPLGMSDTTFWPSEDQVKRIALSYRPNAEKNDLVEFPISQLIYPLSDRTRRFPMPAGGLFSSAKDTATFCRMMLAGGELNGKRYLSEASVKELTTRQTPKEVNNNYGLGFALGDDWFGHGGAHATNMHIYPSRNFAVIWMVQHAGFPGEGGKAQVIFRDWALSTFGR